MIIVTARLLARHFISVSRSWSVDFHLLVHELKQTQRPGISPNLTIALVFAEDRRFWTHAGIDMRAVCRAIYRFLLHRKLEGASTIEQQLVRVVTARYEITLRRKIREIIFAIALGSVFTKKDLLILYLVRGYYGWQMFGLFQACEHLRIDFETASQIQAASLVARLRYPEPLNYSVVQHSRIERRIQYILGALAPSLDGVRTFVYAPHKEKQIQSNPRN